MRSCLLAQSSGSMATMQLLDQAPLLSTTAPQLVVSSTVSSSSLCRVADERAFPVCRGLRSIRRKSVPSSPAASPSASPRLRRVVIKAQETVTGVTGVVNDSTWKSLVEDANVAVLVDFWAPWCGPCRMIAPIVDEIAKEYAGKVRCLKLNTDESPNTATAYGIRSIPTVMVFLKGEKRDIVIGAVPMQTLTSTLDKYITW